MESGRPKAAEPVSGTQFWTFGALIALPATGALATAIAIAATAVFYSKACAIFYAGSAGRIMKFCGPEQTWHWLQSEGGWRKALPLLAGIVVVVVLVAIDSLRDEDKQ